MTSFFHALTLERTAAAAETRRGIGMPAAGGLYWLAVAWLHHVYAPRQAMVYAFALTGLVFPVGAALTRLAGGNLFAKRPGLTALGLQLAALQLFFWPVIILVWRLAPEWAPWAMAILFGSHFLPYSWLYGSRAYAFLTISVAVALTILAAVTRAPHPVVAPMITAGCYAVAVAWLGWENRMGPRRSA